jgi:tetratricopeptide (TPR) repeat protein
VSSRTLGGVGVAQTGGTSPPGTIEGNLAGTTLAGRYDVLDLLGAGGMGAVYRAHDRELDEVVALKVMRGDFARQRGAVEQFRQEVKLARRVTHVNIARTFELGVEGDLMFCTMELVEGESLRATLAREGALPVAQAAAIASAICEGLAVAHAAGVIHRDIKPENVLLTPSTRVVLADFGVAAFSAADSDGALVGTLEYMAPEQARGEQATPATDVYAVGVVLFEMLCGMRAFAGTMSELLVAKQDVEKLSLEFAEAVAREPLPGEIKQLVERATARDPAHRIATAAELARRLAPFLAVERVATTFCTVEPPDLTLPTIVVLAPRAADKQAALHVAEGIHQETLRRLAGKRLRVWPRVDAFDMPGATFVELVAGKALVVTLRRDQLLTTLELPLEISNIALAADAIAVAANELAHREVDSDEHERLELLLRARAHAHAGFGGIMPAIELLEGGRARWPDDPRIACQLADMLLRYVFITPSSPLSFYEAQPLVEAALAGAPHLAEAHVSAGQLALHTGDPIHAAREFRIAIACSPYQAEPHEGLGRLLLEAGFLDDAMSRIDSALAIAPKLSSVRWEIARAHALEQNWLAHDQLVTELVKDGDRPIARLRFAVWRGNRDQMAESYVAWKTWGTQFESELFDKVYSVFLDRTWARDRDAILDACTSARSPSKRRLLFLAQVAAELAAYAGEVDTTLALLDRAVNLDLFDRHWFDRCPLLEVVRATPEGQRLQQRVRVRAESILDALYGELEERPSMAATVLTP